MVPLAGEQDIKDNLVAHETAVNKVTAKLDLMKAKFDRLAALKTAIDGSPSQLTARLWNVFNAGLTTLSSSMTAVRLSWIGRIALVGVIRRGQGRRGSFGLPCRCLDVKVR